MSTSTPRLLGIVGALSVALGACSTGAPATPSPVASVAPTATMLATATAPSSILPAAIADGTYATAPVLVTDIDARIRADTALTAAQMTDAIAGFSGHTSEAFRISLANGQFTEYESFDGGAFEVDVRATFVLPDDHTLVIQESCCGTSTFDVTKVGTGFALRYRAHKPLNAEDDLLGRIVYESAPFALVP